MNKILVLLMLLMTRVCKITENGGTLERLQLTQKLRAGIAQLV
jgi:hypothetical protein